MSFEVLHTRPSISLIASPAAASEANFTKPYPLDCPVTRSHITLTAKNNKDFPIRLFGYKEPSWSPKNSPRTSPSIISPCCPKASFKTVSLVSYESPANFFLKKITAPN